jgi:hypothetical protein
MKAFSVSAPSPYYSGDIIMWCAASVLYDAAAAAFVHCIQCSEAAAQGCQYCYSVCCLKLALTKARHTAGIASRVFLSSSQPVNAENFAIW